MCKSSFSSSFSSAATDRQNEPANRRTNREKAPTAHGVQQIVHRRQVPLRQRNCDRHDFIMLRLHHASLYRRSQRGRLPCANRERAHN